MAVRLRRAFGGWRLAQRRAGTAWWSLVVVLGSAVAVAASALFGSAISAGAAGSTIDVVALGDSYISGTGTGTYDYNAACHRSSSGFPHRYRQALIDGGNSATVVNAACQGTETSDLLAQWGSLSASQRGDADIVLISSGGNDAGFATLVEDCLTPLIRNQSDCNSAVSDALSSLSGVNSRLQAAATVIAGEAPNARIVLVGYPGLLSPSGQKCSGAFNVAQIQQLQSSHDSLLTAAAANLNGVSPGRFAAEIVSDDFAGRGPCADSNELLHHVVVFSPSQSFHPNAAGAQKYADVLYASGHHHLTPPRPPAPTCSVVGGAIRVTYAPVSGATGYRVQRTTGVSVGSGPGLQVDDGNAANGVAYRYQLQAYNGNQNSPWSPASAACTVQLPPTSTGTPVCATQSNGTVRVSWNASDGRGLALQPYRVDVREAQSNQVVANRHLWADAAAGITHAIDTFANPGERYEYRVTIATTAGHTDSPWSASCIAGKAPAPTGKPVCTALANGKVEVLWNASDGFGTDLLPYRVDVRVVNRDDSATMLPDSSRLWAAHPATSAIDSPPAGEIRQYRVTVANGVTQDDSEWSDWCSSGNPKGAFNSVSSPGPGQINVSGWAFDPSDVAAGVDIHVYVDGEGHNLDHATLPHSDVQNVFASRFPGIGPNHGFNQTFTTAKTGTQNLCVFAIDIGAGVNQRLGCKSVAITESNGPVISFTSSTSPGPGDSDLSGAVWDPSGVSHVRVLVRNVGTGEYWDGASWVSAWSWNLATLDAPRTGWSLPGVSLVAGSYQVQLWAYDDVGNSSIPPETLSPTINVTGPTSGSLCNGLIVTVDIGAGDLPTSNADVILGTPGPDVISGLAGDDTICGLGGDDTINAGAGDDWVDAGDGDDSVFGLDGADEIYAGAGADAVVGSNGDDVIDGGSGADVLNGGADNDTINGRAGDDEIFGQSGNDILNGDNGDDFIVGVDGVDTIAGGGGSDVLNGGPGGDTVDGNAGDDTIFGLTGNDTLNGGNDNDTVFGQLGVDVITGGLGDDGLSGNEGDDTITDPAGVNVINGGLGDDTITGGSGADQIFGDGQLWHGGDDVLDGGGGPDLIVGFAGQDTIISNDGVPDIVNGGPDIDNCTTDGTDTVFNCP